MVAPDNQQTLPQLPSLIEPAVNMAAYEYRVLVTSRAYEVASIIQQYPDHADCENNFDEIKNRWGRDGFVTKTIKPCRLIARMIALIYNWWSLFVQLAEPDKHYEAIVSRPLLLHGIGKQSAHAAQKTLTIANIDGRERYVPTAYQFMLPVCDYQKY